MIKGEVHPETSQPRLTARNLEKNGPRSTGSIIGLGFTWVRPWETLAWVEKTSVGYPDICLEQLVSQLGDQVSRDIVPNVGFRTRIIRVACSPPHNFDAWVKSKTLPREQWGHESVHSMLSENESYYGLPRPSQTIHNLCQQRVSLTCVSGQLFYTRLGRKEASRTSQ